MENAAFQEYLKLLRGLSGTIGQLIGLERRKLEAVRANDVQAVDDCIRQEQVLSLSLRGAEQKRGKLLKGLGLENVPLSGLPQYAPEGLRIETREAMNELRRKYDEYQSASDAARTALERVLREVDQMLAAERQQQAAQAPAAGGVRRPPRQAAPDGEAPVGGHGADFKA